jgi:hypothetical protein
MHKIKAIRFDRFDCGKKESCLLTPLTKANQIAIKSSQKKSEEKMNVAPVVFLFYFPNE